MKAALKTAFLAARLPLLRLAGLLKKRNTFNPGGISKILLIRTDRLGDMILTTPFIAAMKEAFPGARLTMLASKGPLRMVRFNPGVSETVEWDESLRSGLLEKLRAEKFDLAIDLHYDYPLATARFCADAGARISCGFDIAGRGELFDLPVPAKGNRHFTRELWDILSALGISVPMKKPEIYFDSAVKTAASDFLKLAGLAGHPYAVIHPGGHYQSQRWPAERFAGIAAFLEKYKGMRTLAVGGPDELELLREAAPDRPSYFGGDPLMTAALIEGAALFVGNNSGPLHMACALGVPNASTMGPTDPVRFAPLGEKCAVARGNPLSLVTEEAMRKAVCEVLG